MVDVSGRWVKDRPASDSMGVAARMVHLNFVMTRAIALIKGLDIDHRGDAMDLRIFSEVPFFKVREQYAGHAQRNMRRDLRRGGVTAWMVPRPTHVELHFHWEAPYAGSETDLLVPVGASELHTYHRLTVGGETHIYRQIYRK
mmetsp:Transcript_12199/g.34408  ORF Transcript_12199/g.34408 Transcript_12199/m.34408 type:complete len:143 (-) Transcript_12199:460-888(-)